MSLSPFIPRALWFLSDIRIRIHTCTVNRLVASNWLPVVYTYKFIIVPMVTDRLTDRLGSKPIMSVRVNLTGDCNGVSYTERQRQGPLESIVTLENWWGRGARETDFQASQCIPMDLDAAADARCGYALTDTVTETVSSYV